jgi:phage shock protein A
MKLLDRILLFLKAGSRRLAGDLFQEEAPLAADASRETLDSIRQQLAGLEAERGRAIATEEKARQDWQAVLAQAGALDERADETLRAGDEAAARQITVRLNVERRRAAGLEQVYREAGRVRAYWDGELAALQPRVDRLAAQFEQVEAQRQRLEGVSAWDAGRREFNRELDGLQGTLDRLQARMDVRRDRMAARQELPATGGKEATHDTDR